MDRKKRKAIINQMEEQQTQKELTKANSSFKWAALGEVLAKIMSPLMNIFLARLLSPSVFGIVASVSIVISFAEMVCDGGFAKYLLQKHFVSETEKKRTFQTALTSSLSISLLLFATIVIWRDFFCSLVNAEGYGTLLILAAVQIPLYAAVSILYTNFRREYQYKKLTLIRVIAIVLQIGTAIGLAAAHLGEYSIIVASLVAILTRLILLLFFSKFRFGFGFSGTVFLAIFSSSFLFLIEAVISWFNGSVDVFILGKLMSQTDAGIFKNALNTTLGIITLFDSIFTPVVTRLLSELKDDNVEFNKTILYYQKSISFLLAPVAVGMFCFRDFLSYAFFGAGWDGAALVIGAFALSSCFKLATGNFVISAFNAKEMPLMNVISDFSCSVAILVAVFLFSSKGFTAYTISRSIAMVVPSIVSLFLGQKKLGISAATILKNLLFPIFLSLLMALFDLAFQSFSSSIWWNLLLIGSSAVLYFLLMRFFVPNDLHVLFSMFVRTGGTKEKGQ